MKTEAGFFRVLCWLCVALALTTCMYDVSLAQSPEEGATPDSLDIRAEDVQAGQDLLLADTPSDSLETGSREIQPFYRKWWVWALVTTAIAVIAVLAGGDGKDKTEEDLPDFPDPPDR